MPQNLVSATLSATLAGELLADIAAFKAKQAAFLLALSAEEKQDLMKMGSGNLALEGHIRSAATENPGELASKFPLAAWDQDRAFAAAYRPVVAALQKLNSDMEDTLLAADSDAWTVAMDAYGDIKKDGVGPAIDQARAIMRAKDNSFQAAKSVPDDLAREIYRSILDETGGTLVLLDWDNRVPRIAHGRIKHLTDDWKRLEVGELLAAIVRADLVVGIDSGPLHLCRYTATPSVGLWFHGHHPAKYSLPRENQVNITLKKHALRGNKYTRWYYNIVEEHGDQIRASDRRAHLPPTARGAALPDQRPVRERRDAAALGGGLDAGRDVELR